MISPRHKHSQTVTETAIPETMINPKTYTCSELKIKFCVSNKQEDFIALHETFTREEKISISHDKFQIEKNPTETAVYIIPCDSSLTPLTGDAALANELDEYGILFQLIKWEWDNLIDFQKSIKFFTTIGKNFLISHFSFFT